MATTTPTPAAPQTVRVRMNSNETARDGSALMAGKTYSLREDSANHWVKRGKAVRLGAEADVGDRSAPVAGPSGEAGSTLDAAAVAAREQELGLQGGPADAADAAPAAAADKPAAAAAAKKAGK